MKLKSNILLILSILFWGCFSGCSWVEYFTVGNLSDASIFVSYKINPLSEGMSFGIFDTSPKFYKLYKKGGVQWKHEIKIKDMDDSPDGVSVSLPANTVMIFGRLHNDNYESTEQYFINGREFNLDFMEIEVNLEVHHISKDTFDKHFTKKNGFIKFDVE